MRRTLSAAAVFLLALAACSPAPDRVSVPAPPVSSTAPAPAPAANVPLVIFLGDSLTAGYGLAADQAFPALVEKSLKEKGVPVRVLNAGVSGDTTAAGLARLDWLLSQKPDLMAVELGGNDGLRGLPIDQAERNLREIVRRSKAAGARVLLLGMLIPPNYGPEYTKDFAEMYPRIAKDLDVPLVPFILEGVGGVARLNQADGIHPTAEGQEKVAETVMPYLVEMLTQEAQAASR